MSTPPSTALRGSAAAVATGDAASAALPPLADRQITIVSGPPGPKAQEMIAHEQAFVSPSLIYCYPLVVSRASGCMVEDVDGNVFLDCQAGVATASTGHCHPAVTAAIAAQAEILIHICGTDFHYRGYGEICEKLAVLAARIDPGGERHRWQTFLTNSGTEGVEAAIKLSRHHTKRTHLIAFRGGFHGRTLGALSLTASKSKYRKGFGPLISGVHHADYGVAESIERELFAHTVSPEDVAAIVVEPVLGEGGYVVPPPEFLPQLREICDQHGILLVFDEVQSGMGRTGRMFAAEHTGVAPDIIVLSKGIASGMPLGAMMARQELMTWPAGSHGSTIAGNPVCIAAALATIELLEGGLLQNAESVGALLKERLKSELAGVAMVEEVRGIGLMIGVEFQTPSQASQVAQECFRRGLLVLECGRKTIRFSPPLTLTAEQATTAAAVFARACQDIRP
jgi:4-aminobutyrate aminotransferase